MRILSFMAIALVLVPAAILATLAALPLWRWIENDFGIESIGHSGPAGWCYLTVYAVLLLGAIALGVLARNRQGGASRGS